MQYESIRVAEMYPRISETIENVKLTAVSRAQIEPLMLDFLVAGKSRIKKKI